MEEEAETSFDAWAKSHGIIISIESSRKRFRTSEEDGGKRLDTMDKVTAHLMAKNIDIPKQFQEGRKRRKSMASLEGGAPEAEAVEPPVAGAAAPLGAQGAPVAGESQFICVALTTQKFKVQQTTKLAKIIRASAKCLDCSPADMVMTVWNSEGRTSQYTIGDGGVTVGEACITAASRVEVLQQRSLGAPASTPAPAVMADARRPERP